MEIYVSFWWIPSVLMLSPFVYGWFRPSQGDYDFGVDVMLFFTATWPLAIGLSIAKLLADFGLW